MTTTAAATAGNGARLTLACGPAVTVTPAAGFCLDADRMNFEFSVQTGAETAADANCAFTLHQGAVAFYDPLAPPAAVAVPVAAQPTLAVSPASSVQSPIVVGTGGVASLTLTPSADLSSGVVVETKCNNLAVASAGSTVQLVAEPGAATVTMGSAAGFVECRFLYGNSADPRELAAAPVAFFQIVAPMQLAATGMPTAADALPAGDVPTLIAGGAAFTISVAPPTTPQAFELTLTCTEAAPVTATFTTATTTAQTLSVTAPAARGDGASLRVSCEWSGAGVGVVQHRVALPPNFNFVVAASVVVTTSAAPTQLTAAAPTSVITVSVPGGTAFTSNILIEAKCSAGSLPTSMFMLRSGELSATATYIAAPTIIIFLISRPSLAALAHRTELNYHDLCGYCSSLAAPRIAVAAARVSWRRRICIMFALEHELEPKLL